MPRATTAPVALPLADDPQSRLAAARAEAAKIASERAAAEKTASDLREALEKLRQEQLAAEAAAAKIAEAESRAKQAAVDAERQIEPDQVTVDIARSLAETLVAAFEACDDGDANKTVPMLWSTADDVRCRLLTSAVDDDARALVLATEGVILALDEWESARSPEFNDTLDDEKRQRLEIRDIRHQFRPADSERISRRVRELRLVLDGQSPPPVAERIGELIAQGVSLNQICRMLGLMRVDGTPSLSDLGSIVDGALLQFGYYDGVARWHHQACTGLMDFDSCWLWRQAELARRRQFEQGRPGSPARLGETRFGREANYRPHIDEASELTPAFRADLAKIARGRADARAAARAAAAHDDAPLNRF